MTESGSALQILSTRGADARSWTRTVEKLDEQDRDIHFSLAYARAHERSSGCDVFLARYAKDESYVLMPFVLRDVRDLPFLEEASFDGPVYDIASMYAFGGPMARISDRRARRQIYCDFQTEFGRYCAARRIVSQFTAFHPLLANHKGLQETGLVDVRQRKEVVWIDLRKDEPTLYRELTKHHRRNLDKARRLGVVAEPGPADTAGLALFETLYAETMGRVGASARWTFGESYFCEFVGGLGPDRVSLFHAKREDRILASAMVLRGGDTVYYHLSGSCEEGLLLRANYALIYELALWSKRQGCRRLLLGGGAEPDDGLFRFKAGFSGDRAWFYTANVTYEPRLYRQLCAARDEWDRVQGREPEPSDFFPGYRRRTRITGGTTL